MFWHAMIYLFPNRCPNSSGYFPMTQPAPPIWSVSGGRTALSALTAVQCQSLFASKRGQVFFNVDPVGVKPDCWLELSWRGATLR